MRHHATLRRPFHIIENFDKPMRNYWGEKIRRPIPILRLKPAIEDIQYDTREGNEVLRSIEKAFGTRGTPFKKLKWQLYQEGSYQWVFVVTGYWSRSTSKSLILILAKDSRDRSRLAQVEYRILCDLHARRPDMVVDTVGSMNLPLGGDSTGSLFGYFSELIPDFTELGIDKDHRFHLVGIEKEKRLSPKASEGISGAILSLLVSLYDPEAGSALVDVEVNSGDFLGRIDAGPQVRLIAARRLRSGLSPAGLVRLLLAAKGKHADADVYLYPETPQKIAEALLAGFVNVHGGDRREAWHVALSALVKNAKGGFPLPRTHLTWDMLVEAMRCLEPPARSVTRKTGPVLAGE